MRKPPFMIMLWSASALAAGAMPLCAQEYPTRPIRLVTSPVGGGTDFATRVVSQGLAANLGQPVVVDNRPGPYHGVYLPKAPPDGYSLLIGGEGIWQRTVLEKVPYDLRDFSAVSLLGISPNVLVVHPSLPVKSVKDLIDLAKAKPADLNYGATAAGGSADFAAQLFMGMTGVKLTAIPHKGTGDALISVVSGQGVHLGFFSIAPSAPQVKSGKLRALAVTSPKRSAILPDLPTVADTVPGYQFAGATAMWAPPGTSASIITRLNREVVRVLSTSESKEKFLTAGIDVVATSPAELAAFVKADVARLAKIVKDAGIKVEQ